MTAAADADAAGIRVVHHVPGRMRVRVEGSREPSEMLQMVAPVVAGLPEVLSIRVNAASGSVVVHYATDGARSGRIPHFPAAAVARGVLFSLASGMAARAVLPGRRGLPVWFNVALVTYDTIVAVQRLRRLRGDVFLSPLPRRTP